MHRACRRASDDAIARCEERATAFHAHSHARVPLPTFMAHPVASRVESSEGRKVEPGRLLIVIQYGTCWERNIDGAQCLPNRGLSTLPHRPRREPASQQLEEALRAPSTLPQLAVGRSTSLGSQGPAKCLASTFAPVIPVPSDLPVNGVPSTHPGAGCEGETGLTGQTDISPTVLGVCRWPSSDATPVGLCWLPWNCPCAVCSCALRLASRRQAASLECRRGVQPQAAPAKSKASHRPPLHEDEGDDGRTIDALRQWSQFPVAMTGASAMCSPKVETHHPKSLLAPPPPPPLPFCCAFRRR